MDPLLGMALWPAVLIGIGGLVARAAAGAVHDLHDEEDPQIRGIRWPGRRERATPSPHRRQQGLSAG
jgi:hypothetical protein